jgi:hypothetical protein
MLQLIHSRKCTTILCRRRPSSDSSTMTLHPACGSATALAFPPWVCPPCQQCCLVAVPHRSFFPVQNMEAMCPAIVSTAYDRHHCQFMHLVTLLSPWLASLGVPLWCSSNVTLGSEKVILTDVAWTRSTDRMSASCDISVSLGGSCRRADRDAALASRARLRLMTAQPHWWICHPQRIAN